LSSVPFWFGKRLSAFESTILGLFERKYNLVQSFTFFLPAIGVRMYDDGSRALDGTRGHYWSSTQLNSGQGLGLNFDSGSSSTAWTTVKSHGPSIRCVREIKYFLLACSRLPSSRWFARAA